MRTIIIGLLALFIALPIGQSAQLPSSEEASREYFTDLVLLTQNGEEVRFFTDVLKDHVVLVSFIFTNCESACPLITEKMSAARDMLGEEFGGNLRLISISIDPERDTPQAMKEFAAHHQADGNWMFLTGARENIDQVVKKLGQYSADVEAHSTVLIVGNVNQSHWMKIPPMAGPGGVAQSLRALIEPI